MPALAEMNERATSAHQEARAALSKTAANHCPFGCQAGDLDDHGYCFHLMGFTDDKKTYEPVAPIYRTTEDGTPFNTGFKIVQGRQECLPTDTFVNPQRPQQVAGIIHMADAWVSARVYRARPRPAEEIMPEAKPSELYQLQARKRELERKREERTLKEEIAKLESELGEDKPTKKHKKPDQGD